MASSAIFLGQFLSRGAIFGYLSSYQGVRKNLGRAAFIHEEIELTDNQITTSVKDTARRLGISRTKVYDLIKAGLLQTAKLGSRRLVIIESMHRLVKIPEAKSKP
jgi:excisionase family DNA binding protein